jgi:hypothetical protein
MLQICKKFFGTFAVTHLAVKNVSLLQKTLTFTSIIAFPSDRQTHTMMDSPLTRWIIIRMLITYMFSLISLVEYFSNAVKNHGLSTTSGERTGFLFSKAGIWHFFSSLSPVDIFSDVCGKLDGESIVGAPIQGKPCKWCRIEESLPSQPEVWVPIQDWRDAILHVLHSQDTKIRITIVTESAISPAN